MSNQHSVIALDWLNPVLQEVFVDLIPLLKRERDVDMVVIAEKLHQVTGALRLINQPELSNLSFELEKTSHAIEQGELSDRHCADISQAIVLLQYEVKQLQQTHHLHRDWVEDRTHYFQALLGENTTTHATFLDTLDLPISQTVQSAATDTATLVKVWRYHTLKLLETNANQREHLQPLAEVATYLATSQTDNYRKLWQITAQWLLELAENPQPKPHAYAYVLNALDNAIQDTHISANQLSCLAVDVLLQGVTLKHKSEHIQQLLMPLKVTAIDDNASMFKQVLNKLEQAIFQMATPAIVLPQLQDIKAMLTNRGWQFYENHLEQIISDIQMMVDDPASADMISWQVERQMQDLYSQLMQTTDTLESQVGIAQFSYAKNPEQEAVRQTRIHLENIKLAFNDYVQSRNVDSLLVNEDLTAMSQVFDILGLERPKILAEQLRVLFGQLVSHGLNTISWETSDTLAEMIAQFELFLDYLSHQNVNDSLLEQTQQLLLKANSLVADQIQRPVATNELASREKSYTANTALYDDSGEVIAEGNTIPASHDTDAEDNDGMDIDLFDDFADDFAAEMPAPPTSEFSQHEIGIADTAIVVENNTADTPAIFAQPQTSAETPVVMDVEESVETITPITTAAELQADSDELLHARSLLKPDEDGMDEDIREIFIEEAEEVLTDMKPNLATWQAHPNDFTTLKEIRRGFHTLKGSGRMVGAFQVGETAWSVENMLNRVLDNTVPVTPEMVEFIQDTHTQLPTLVADYAAGQSPSIDPAIIILKATNLTQQRPLLQGVPTTTSVVTPATAPVQEVAQAATQDFAQDLKQSPAIDEALDTQVGANYPALETQNTDELFLADGIDNGETTAEISNLAEVTAETDKSTNDISDTDGIDSEWVADVETEPTIAQPAIPAEIQPAILADSQQDSEQTDSKQATPVSSTASYQLPAILQTEIDSLEWKADDIMDEDIQEIYVEEAQEVLEEITPLYQQWRTNTGDTATLKEIRRGFHTLKGSGRMVGANQLGELGWSIENMLNRIMDNTIVADTGAVALIGDVLETFPSLVETFAQSRDDYPEIIRLWAAAANIYSKKQGDSIDYLQLSNAPHTVAADVVTSSATKPQTITTALAETQETPATSEFENNNGVELGTEAESVTATGTEPAEPALITTEFNTAGNADSPALQSSQTDEVLEKDELESELRFSVGDTDDIENTEGLPTDDHVIGQVFLEESHELLQKIDKFIAKHEGEADIAVPDELVRVFHTLRGGAALSELPRVYALSAALENGLDNLIRQEAPLNAEKLVTLAQTRQLLASYIDDYKNHHSVASLSEDENNHSQLLDSLFAETTDAPITHAMNVTQLLELGIDDLLEADIHYSQKVAPAQTDSPADTQSLVVAQSLDEPAKAYINRLYEQSKTLDEAVSDSKFAPLAHALKNAYRYLHQYPVLAQDDEVTKALLQTHAQLTNVFDEIAAGMNIHWNEAAIIDLNTVLAEKVRQEQIAQIEYEPVRNDNDLVEIFLDEVIALGDSFNLSFSQWQNNLTNLNAVKELQRYSNAVAGGARLVGIQSIHPLADAAKSVYSAILDGKLENSTDLVDIMQQVHDTLSAQVQSIKQHSQSFYAKELQTQLNTIAQTGEVSRDILLAVPVLLTEAQTNEGEEVSEIATETVETPQITTEYSQDIINNFEQRRIQTWEGQEPDEDILQIYLEEAKELVDSSSQNLQEFRSNTANLTALQALQRELHTIKGGARMVGAEGLATLAHEMETVYEELGSRRKPATRMIGNLLAACHDWLASALYVLENKYNPELPQPLVDALLQFSKNPDSLKVIPQASLANQVEQIKIYQSSLAAKEEGKKRDLSVMPLQIGNFSEDLEQTNTSTEMIRVPASLMERMINLSGESAINRARIDMGVSSLTNTIEEMGVTVQRLADQLRRMDNELEEQILSNIDDNLLQNPEFDALEMDQYSSLNQLSKSLSESASDLLDIKTTILDKTRDTENLLLQLSRTQLELQEGLMTSRTVPFSRITPRLQRIVRQTANELNKSVELRILNDEGEIDRNILERITSPLEHMLRNAVDHGIERTQERIESGKSRTGLVTLEVEREGDEIVVYLTDDGKGINVEAVRKKAIEQGLINADDTSLTPVDIMQYIFNAGLSTSASITQISGRGVGMDVVQSEIKQLGGVVSVDSEAGKGSRFILRLPLTVAVSDALVVRAADKSFAVPLVQIERVVRINAETVYQFYDSDAATIDIDGEPYRLRYLNQILYNTDPRESVRQQIASVPIIIIRNETGQKLALQVDGLAGSRVEVVVKPLGKQLAHISGISAATIMGDGSVMLILDLNALMRNATYTAATTGKTTTATVRTTKPVVLIIDDSVTVRKVTSRLLERHGYETQVAKDGIDALEKLQELTPDIMLLDIEMPRMDGFEVATQVRHNSRLKQVPIIMITSRTGEKHRERAMSIGVNEYMGKPFQEQDLVDTISHLLNAKMAN